nr:MAG TPA: DNA ligase [Caudoviricetes sp.]
MKTLEELIDKLNKASKAYYSGASEIMSDKEFDNLYDKLKKLEQVTGIILPNSPTQRVGYKVMSNLPKVAHEYPSLSLDKTKERTVMAEWLGAQVGVLSWKCDGLTIILTYDNGELVSAATRGDGCIGEEITHNALHFNNVPKRIDDKRHVVIRGEAVIPYERFKAINKTLLDDKRYKNPRNMASGAARLLDSKKSSTFGITFIPFDLVNAKELGCLRMSEGLEFISSLGLKPVDWVLVNDKNLVGIIDEKEKTAKELPFPTDGLVIVYDDLSICNNLGSTSKYPRYAKAFKWPDKLETTILRRVDWSRAETGLISPIAVFDPVELEGTIVKRASVHNLSIMKELGLGIGDHIKVYKANMIIPQIFEDVEKSNNVPIPTTCPICGSTLEQRIGVNGKSEFLYCTNNSCLTERREK